VSADLSPEQERALDALARVVDPSSYYLGGGVAVALRLHHRRSVDLNLFTTTSDPPALAEALKEASIVITSTAPGTLHLEVGGVPASLLRYRYPLLGAPERVPGVPLPLASLDDLECMKLSAIVGRGARRDFWDLHALLEARGKSLGEVLVAYRRKYAQEDIGHVVRSLVYFAEADAEPMATGLTEAHWARIRSDFTTWVREL
jgi:hypothetical protein